MHLCFQVVCFALLAQCFYETLLRAWTVSIRAWILYSPWHFHRRPSNRNVRRNFVHSSQKHQKHPFKPICIFLWRQQQLMLTPWSWKWKARKIVHQDACALFLKAGTTVQRWNLSIFSALVVLNCRCLKAQKPLCASARTPYHLNEKTPGPCHDQSECDSAKNSTVRIRLPVDLRMFLSNATRGHLTLFAKTKLKRVE